MFENGLDATKTLVMNSDSLSTIIDTHGILTRQYNYDTGSYDPCQLRITNGTIAITDDGWKTISAAFGKIVWKNQECYGIIAEKLIGQALIGNTFEINNVSGTYTINDDGFRISNNGNSISLNADDCSFNIEYQGKKALYFTPQDGLYISGKIRGGSININDKFIVDENGDVTAVNGKFSGTVTDSTFNINGKSIIDTDGNIETNSVESEYAVLGKWGFYGDIIKGIASDNIMHIIRAANKLWIDSSDTTTIATSSKVEIPNCPLYVRAIHNTDIIFDLNLSSDQNIILTPGRGIIILNGHTEANDIQINGNLYFKEKDGTIKTLKPECFI